jgi:hypothetical protein
MTNSRLTDPEILETVHHEREGQQQQRQAMGLAPLQPSTRR